MSKQRLCLFLIFHIFCLINTTKFEFVKKKITLSNGNFEINLKFKISLGSVGNHLDVTCCQNIKHGIN
jgi:hypothetical protein